jgi:hypothetical protein
MEDTSTHSGNKLIEEQIEQLIKRLRGVEHIEPIVTIEDSNVNNEKSEFYRVWWNQTRLDRLKIGALLNHQMHSLYFVPRVYYQIRLYCFYYCSDC